MTSLKDQIDSFLRESDRRWEAKQALIEQGLPPRRIGRSNGGSVVFSFRLDAAEVELLELRAAQIGIKPSVLARNLVRVGLASNDGESVARVVDQLEATVAELRSLIP